MSELRIITAPKVQLISRQEFIHPEGYEGWESTSDVPGEVVSEFAGRLCYMSFGQGEMDGHKMVKGRPENYDYLSNIKVQRHGSITEHAVYGFLLEGISRSLSHELVRHRAGMSFSQLSQRYVDESGVAFVLPPEIIQDPMNDVYSFWHQACRLSLASYRRILEVLGAEMVEGEERKLTTEEKKRARQTARSVLPNATETKMVVTGNVRAWRHFIELRASAGADQEIRRLAVAVLRALQEEAPALFGDYTISRHTDGTEIATTTYVKV